MSLNHNYQKSILSYLVCVLLVAIILIIINPVPLMRGDLWAEDGRYYFADTFRVGFWDALKVNFLLKGYPQLLKYILGYLSILINQFFFGDNLLYYSHISALISYCTYGLVFALPILLFSSLMDRKSLYALPIICCFVAIGQDNISVFLTFGRILNTGFLSIYLCFLLVAYRLINFEVLRLKYAIIIDFFILICLFTQPVNLIIVSFLYLIKIYQYFKHKIHLNSFLDLSFLSLGITSYLVLIITNGIMQSHGQSNFDDSHSFPIKPLLGKMIFNNYIGSVYSDIPTLIPIVLFMSYLFLSYYSRLLIHWYAIYVLILLPIISEIWRPGLLTKLDNSESGVYAMPTLLISLFLTFSLLSYFLKNKHSKGINYGIWSLVVMLILLNGIYANDNQNSAISTVTIEDSFQLAQPGKEDIAVVKFLNVDRENRMIYELPINPEGWSMLFLKEDFETVKSYL
jgi:hypothetical protein